MMKYLLSWWMHLVNIVMMKMMMMEMTILMKEMTSKKIGKVTGWVCLSADFKNEDQKTLFFNHSINLFRTFYLIDFRSTVASFSSSFPLPFSSRVVQRILRKMLLPIFVHLHTETVKRIKSQSGICLINAVVLLRKWNIIILKLAEFWIAISICWWNNGFSKFY